MKDILDTIAWWGGLAAGLFFLFCLFVLFLLGLTIPLSRRSKQKQINDAVRKMERWMDENS